MSSGSSKRKREDSETSDDTEIEFGTQEHINDILKHKKYTTLTDLIELGESYGEYIENNRRKRRRSYYNNVDLYQLYNIIPYLSDLNEMIGMKSLKEDIVYQILYYLSDSYNCEDLMHTVIMGTPGTGKTEVATIIANIYIKLGFLSKNKIKFARRCDLIANYLGQTAGKTQRLLESCKGGCLIIDEAYSLGNDEKRDSYSKECLDTINQFLTEHKSDFLCIIIGYEHQLKTCFFNYNPGLERRFPWRYKITPYNSIELLEIFKSQIEHYGWELNDSAIDKTFFENNKDLFKNYGGDTEVLFTKCKMAHISRIFGELNAEKKVFTKKDIDNGFKIYKKHKNDKDHNPYILSMYT